MANPADKPIMLHEMATIGTGMSLVTLASWGTIVTLSHYMPKIAMLRAVEQAKRPFIPR